MMTNYIYIVASLIPLTLHLIGIYLLHTKSEHLPDNQKTLLTNLSISEIILCAYSIVYSSISYFDLDKETDAIVLCSWCMGSLSFYLILQWITIDRFLYVYLNIKYSIILTARFTRAVVAGIWMLLFALNVVTLVLYLTKRFG